MHGGGKNWGRDRREEMGGPGTHLYIISTSLKREALATVLLVPPFEHLFDTPSPKSFFLYFLPKLPLTAFPSQLPHDGSSPFS